MLAIGGSAADASTRAADVNVSYGLEAGAARMMPPILRRSG
jgi:hypothetical protein